MKLDDFFNFHRLARADRMKASKTEADEVIAKYKDEKEAEYQRKVAAVSNGSMNMNLLCDNISINYVSKSAEVVVRVRS